MSRPSRQDREALAAGGLGKPFVEADELIALWGFVTPDQRRRKLERVGGAERVPGEEPASAVADWSRRRNNVYVGHQGLQSLECLSQHRGR
jgi:hypothetical protein